MENIITNQDHINDEIVARKREAGDYDVMVSPEIDVDGEIYRVLLDGHHSLAAAIADGKSPVIIEATGQDNDALSGDMTGTDLIDALGQGEGGWIYAVDGNYVW